MKTLIQLVKKVSSEKSILPFSVYSSFKEQHILNVPVIKPLLVFILNGSKQLGRGSDVLCPAGSFVFLSNSPTIDMRNIPENEGYFAVLIEFDYSDFSQFKRNKKSKKYFQGELNSVLEKTLSQYIEWSVFSPPEAWHFRKKELLQILYQLGYDDVSAIAEPPSLSHQLHDIISENFNSDVSVGGLAEMLSMSESTLRRKLNAEGVSIQAIKDRAKLGHGLHLVQTSMEPIGRVAELCGYYSQSRFTHKFKQLFGITPSELRKTRMHD